jgi:DNA-binding YbaB/EbfC family protein
VANQQQQQMKMLRQIQKMQEDMQAAQDALANATVEASAGGGVVTAVVTGDGELRRISIDPSVVDPEDVETLEDLVVAAITEATRQARELQQEKLGGVTSGLDLGGALGGLGDLTGGGGLGGLLPG